MYDDNFTSDAVDPLSGHGHEEFPWAELAAALGESDSIMASDEARSQAARAVRVLLGWLVGTRRFSAPGEEVVLGRRVIAMVWAVDPGLIAGSPSLAEIAEALGCTRAGLSWHAAKFSKEFGIANRCQPHGSRG